MFVYFREKIESGWIGIEDLEKGNVMSKQTFMGPVQIGLCKAWL